MRISDWSSDVCSSDLIPTIAIKVLEHGHRAIGLVAGLADELHASGDKAIVVSPEVVGLQEQEDTAASLIADEDRLLRRRCAGEKQRCSRAACRRDNDPTLVLLGACGVLKEFKAEHADVEGNCIIVEIGRAHI